MLTRIPNVGETIKITNCVTKEQSLAVVTPTPEKGKIPGHNEFVLYFDDPNVIWFQYENGKRDCIIAKFPDRFNSYIEIVAEA